MAGVSARTLRHYENIGLLAPARTEAGYRLYGDSDAKRMAQIMAMRSCGLPLQRIKAICNGEDDILLTLKDHLATLEKQRASTEWAAQRTRAAIDAVERMNDMKVEDSFEEMKRNGMAEFEKRFGEEARERYGEAAIDASNERMMNLTRDEWDAKELLEESIKVQLRLAMAAKDPSAPEARELVRMHRRWIAIHWGEGFAEEAYQGLAQGYLADQRFVEYYDSAAGEGATEFLVAAIEAAPASPEA